MNKKLIITSPGIIAAMLCLLLGGCWTTIKESHPLLESQPAAPYARVYFLRPRTERFMGMADNRVTILLDQQPLLELVKGEYTLVRIKPGQAWVAIENQTTYGPAHRVKTETRSRSFTFVAGQTYYIAVKPIDGEFRGVHFLPQALTLAEAQHLKPRMRAVGAAGDDSIPDAAP